jgi:hypothetical protein
MNRTLGDGRRALAILSPPLNGLLDELHAISSSWSVLPMRGLWIWFRTAAAV